MHGSCWTGKAMGRLPRRKQERSPFILFSSTLQLLRKKPACAKHVGTEGSQRFRTKRTSMAGHGGSDGTASHSTRAHSSVSCSLRNS